MSSGIYEILNTMNNKKYIGSSVNINKRWQEHLSNLRRGTHINKHLQSAFNKYGENALVFSIIEVVETPEGLISLEQKYLDNFLPEYNIYSTAGSPLGLKLSKETKRKMGEAHKEKHHSEETKKKISEALKGKPNGLEGKISPKKGKHYGKHLFPMSEEGRANISEAHKGKIHAHKGHPTSEEARKHMSEANKKYWSNKIKVGG